MAPRLTGLKPAQLKLINEIAMCGQLQNAAEALAMTQPAASRMLAQIEDTMGAALFIRQPKGMEPTEIGRIILRRVRVILREMGSMAADVAALRDGSAGSVRVGAVTGPAVSSLVGAIRHIKQQTPRAEISVEVLPSRDLLRMLGAGELDFVLGRILPEFDSHQFHILPMQDERVTLIARSGHPLSRAAVVTFTELSVYEWIMQQRGAPIREAALQAFADAGLSEPANIVSSPSLLLTIAYLSQTDAVAPVSQEVAQLLIRPPVQARFVEIPIPREIHVPPYYLLHLKQRPLSALAARLRDQVARRSGSPIRNADGVF